MPNINLAPYPYAAEQQAIERRRQMAMLLQQQSMQPIEPPPVPGANVSWTQGAAKLVQALVGAYQNNKLDKQQKALETKMLTERGQRAQEMAGALIGEPQGTAATPAQVPGPQSWQPPTFGSTAPPQAMPTAPPTAPPMALPGTVPAQPAQPPSPGAMQKNQALKQFIAQTLASPDPAQQKFGELVANKWLTGDEEEKKQAAAFALEAWKLRNTPREVGANGLYLPGQGVIGGEPKPRNIDPLSPEGQAAQLAIDAKKPRNIDPLSPAGLAAAQTLRSTPTPPMSAERLQQEKDLAATRDAAAQQRADEAAIRRQKIQQSAAPEQIKVGVERAYQTRDMIQNVRDAVKAKPYLLGPVVGRLEQTTQGMGTTFGMQTPQDEQDAATLSGNIGNLLISELQLASGGNRTAVQLLPEIKKFSAQIKDNPNMLEGFLKGTENRAGISINGGKRWGINLETAPSAGGDPVGDLLKKHGR